MDEVRPGWTVDGEPFDAVIVASGRFRRPRLPGVVACFRGEVIHSFSYPGAEPYRDRATLVYGNGISGLEIACDLAPHAEVVSAFRKPRYVIQKVVDGVSSDWQWYTHFGALERRALTPVEWSRRQLERILRVAGDPVDHGAPEPSEDLRVAGVSLCQGYLDQVRDGAIVCRPGIASIEGTDVTFTDGTTQSVEAIVCATGYDVDIPYLEPAREEPARTGPRAPPADLPPGPAGLRRHRPVLRAGPVLPAARAAGALDRRCLERPGAGARRSGHAARDRAGPAADRRPRRPRAHARRGARVAPEPTDWPELCEPLLFGPLLPARYRLCGPGARPEARALYMEQLAASPRAPLDAADLDALRRFGYDAAAARVTESLTAATRRRAA